MASKAKSSTRLEARKVLSKNKKIGLSHFSTKKREQIVQAALDTFLELGYQGTSMNLIAERAGVIKQTIYSHFSDKEGLFKAIIEKVTLQSVDLQFGGPIENMFDEDPRVTLKRFGKALIGRQHDPSYIALLRTIIGESRSFPELARLYTATVIRPGVQLLTGYFKRNPRLQHKDLEAIARIFCGSIINNIITQEILNGRQFLPFESERIVETLIDMILP